MLKAILFIFLIYTETCFSEKILALSFDDAPNETTAFYKTYDRTKELIKKLQLLEVPSVMIFANPCKRSNSVDVIKQLKLYTDAGHLIGNHTCSHLRLDDVGFEKFTADVIKAEKLLFPIIKGQKFFRFPYLNESKDEKLRDRVRLWLKTHNYRNGFVSIDTDDYLFSEKIQIAKRLRKKIDIKKVEALYVSHILNATNFYDEQAIKILGHSPTHVILLHETDATVMFLETLIKKLRRNGWKIISAQESFEDQLYIQQPKNTFTNNGFIAQLVREKTGEEIRPNSFEQLSLDLDQLLGIP